MKRNKLPAQKYLRECFRYSRRTGKLHWRKRPKSHFKSSGFWLYFNERYAGKEALAYQTASGHLQGAVNGKNYMTHRVIWKLVTGFDPKEVDHKDRSGVNNRWKNLREATRQQNNANSVVRKGYHFHKKAQKWAAGLCVAGKGIHLGLFTTAGEAKAARQKAMRERYGEFAP